MKSRSCLLRLSIIAVSLHPLVAHAEDTRAALSKFNLEGHWAVDCAKPPAILNGHITLHIPADGPIIENIDAGAGPMEWTITEARVLTDEKIIIRREWKDDSRAVDVQSVVRKVGNRAQTVDSTATSMLLSKDSTGQTVHSAPDVKQLVKDGFWINDDGTKVLNPPLQRCRE
jgi:hypothetical protein